MKKANPVSRRQVLAVLLSAGVAACARDKPATAAAGGPKAERKTARDFFPIRVGTRVVRLQLAVLEEEMRLGLMGRRDLGPDDGMLFLYERPQQMTFWMRDTPTPLDIGFFGSDGTLAEIHPLHPFDEKTVSSRGTELRYALEMNQGWFQANGVRPGAEIDRKALAAALEARGFVPAKYGL